MKFYKGLDSGNEMTILVKQEWKKTSPLFPAGAKQQF
jgi:hypothetical protein